MTPIDTAHLHCDLRKCWDALSPARPDQAPLVTTLLDLQLDVERLDLALARVSESDRRLRARHDELARRVAAFVEVTSEATASDHDEDLPV